MQLTMPRAVENANSRQGDLTRQAGEQNVFQQEVLKQAEHKQTMVIRSNESHETDEEKVNKDGKNKQENRRGKGGKGKKKESDKKQQGLGLFDVRI
jgi:hypothetical protein